MARSEARIFSAIWAQEDWRSLAPEAQWTYLMLISQSDLAQDGVISLRESRWARLAEGISTETIRKSLSQLEAARWIVIDEMTGELLVRSLIRWDRVYMQPNVMRAAIAHLATVESRIIRRTIYAELMRIVKENADDVREAQDLKPLTGEQKNVITKAVQVLRSTGDGSSEGSGEGGGNPFANPSGKGSGMGSANPLGDRGKGKGVDFEVPTRAHTREELTLFDPEPGASASPPPPARALFGDFWSAYPRHEGKQVAAKAWEKACTRADPAVIIAAARRFADDPNRDPEFTPHPTTWLNQGRWEDDPLPSRGGGARRGNGSSRLSVAMDVAAELAVEEQQLALPGHQAHTGSYRS